MTYGIGSLWESVPVPTDSGSWDVGTPAFVLADVAPTLPLTIVMGVNDTFNYLANWFNNPGAETFTIAPAVGLATLADVIAAVAAATGSGSGERFDTLVTPSDGGSGLILLTEIIHQPNGSTITEGNGGAAAMGFTANPDTFAGQTGSTGRWVIDGAGNFSQTDPLQSHACLYTTASFFGTAFANEMEVTAITPNPTGGDAWDALFASGVPLVPTDAARINQVSGAYASLNGGNIFLGGGIGDSQNGLVDNSLTAPFTLRCVFQGGFLIGYLNGASTPTLQNAGVVEGAGSTGFVDGSARLALYATGAVAFANLKAWRIPVPTLN